MNASALETLIEVADLWARTHVALVEALKESARTEARMAAWLIAMDALEGPQPPWGE